MAIEVIQTKHNQLFAPLAQYLTSISTALLEAHNDMSALENFFSVLQQSNEAAENWMERK